MSLVRKVRSRKRSVSRVGISSLSILRLLSLPLVSFAACACPPAGEGGHSGPRDISLHEQWCSWGSPVPEGKSHASLGSARALSHRIILQPFVSDGRRRWLGP